MPSVKAFAANMIQSAMSSTAMRRGMKRAPMFGASGDRILNSAAIRQRAAAIADDLDYATGPIVVHGSGKSGLKTINPAKGSNALPDRSVNYGWKTKDIDGIEDEDTILNVASNVMDYTPSGGSIYIARAKASSLVTDYEAPSSVITSNQPMRVLKEITADKIETGGTGDAEKIMNELKTNLEKLGVTHRVRSVSRYSDEGTM